jgi:proline-rich protein PRCC
VGRHWEEFNSKGADFIDIDVSKGLEEGRLERERRERATKPKTGEEVEYKVGLSPSFLLFHLVFFFLFHLLCLFDLSLHDFVRRLTIKAVGQIKGLATERHQLSALLNTAFTQKEEVSHLLSLGSGANLAGFVTTRNANLPARTADRKQQKEREDGFPEIRILVLVLQQVF